MTTNNEFLAPQNLVTQISKNIRLENVATNNINAIKKFGAHEDKILGKMVWIIAYADERDLADKLHELSKLDFLFIGEDPAGWPPALVFNKLREKKLVTGNFKEINWRGPGDWFIIER